jgi:glycosyltransferase involved in cell wall biosynthesis
VVDGSFEVLVVDDGSTDRTAAVAAEFPCRLVRHERNRGKGEALKTGIEQARSPVVIWMDADDTYPPDAIPALADALQRDYDLVYASRQTGREQIPLFNRIGNALFSMSVRYIYGFKPMDPCTGLCGVRRDALLRMDLQADRFAIEVEIAMKAARMKLRMLDYPIRYGERIGEAKLRGLPAGLEIGTMILRLLFWRPKSR